MLFRGAVGMVDRDKGIPNTAETVFNTASLLDAGLLVLAGELGRVQPPQPVAR